MSFKICAIDSYVLTCQDPILIRTNFSARQSCIFNCRCNTFEDTSQHDKSIFIAIQKGTYRSLNLFPEFDLPHGNWISLVDFLETSLKKEGKLCSTAPASSHSHHAWAVKREFTMQPHFNSQFLTAVIQKPLFLHTKSTSSFKFSKKSLYNKLFHVLNTLQVEWQSLFLNLSVAWSWHIPKWKNLKFNTYTHKSTQHVNRGMGYSIIAPFEGFHNLHS